MSVKPRVAFFDFAGCEGDQLQVINLEERLLDLFSHVEVVSFREVVTGHSDDYDIAFVEGSITRPEDEERIKEIRRNCTYLIAIGACATIGGINCLKNFITGQDYRELVYGRHARWYSTYAARPLKSVVPVDVELHGCPMDKNEFARCVKELLKGKIYRPPDYPVCLECKKAGNICVFHRGKLCLGIITRAGCGASCVSKGAVCWGCRGVTPDADIDKVREIPAMRDFEWMEIRDLMRIYLCDGRA
jgi:coenzyme F420-reducing hydrogenase gamma subunit